MAKIRSKLDRYTISQKYIVSRGQALKFPVDPFKKDLGSNEVYGAVVDITMSPTVLATLACYINGSANIYFNLGGEYINSAARYRGVAQASYDFIRVASECLDCCKKTTQFDMPILGKHYVYLLTRKGTFMTEITPDAIAKEEESKRKLYNMYQRVMAQLRIAQIKDRDSGVSSGNING